MRLVDFIFLDYDPFLTSILLPDLLLYACLFIDNYELKEFIYIRGFCFLEIEKFIYKLVMFIYF